MKSLGTVKLKRLDGQWFWAEVFESGRDGTMAPQTWYWRIHNRWVAPYEQRLRWFPIPLNDRLKLAYSGPLIRDLLYDANPLLKLIPKNDSFAGKYYPTPLIHGK